ncbi:MAG: deoxyribodipyrimidine photo-lyase [bacterium]
MSVDPRRVHILTKKTPGKGPVVYWMSRDQRVSDNWALLYAHDEALKRKQELIVVFCLVQEFLGATNRHYDFMLTGLQEVERQLHLKSIPFVVRVGEPKEVLPKLLNEYKAGLLVTDFDPLRIKRKWKREVAREISIPLCEVDTHNIVPCRYASLKQEYGAYTLRPKIRRVLYEFLCNIPPLKKNPSKKGRVIRSINWEKLRKLVRIGTKSNPISWIIPGEKAAKHALMIFVKNRLNDYLNLRNDPTHNGQSNLSPYLHFGHIAAQRVAWEIEKSQMHEGSKEAFLEELIVRRELSDNFCFYNQAYDSFRGFPAWGQKTLTAHRKDTRPYRYSLEQLEHARTHDTLWNAAEMQMLTTGKMHGYMRMYWAKKILEWSSSPEQAQAYAIALNDRYELDGRDPNGYAGIAWAIGGVHDRVWGERPIFGKIRYMSYNGCRSKFSVDRYEKEHNA